VRIQLIEMTLDNHAIAGKSITERNKSIKWAGLTFNIVVIIY
jgi:hypothetical protein